MNKLRSILSVSLLTIALTACSYQHELGNGYHAYTATELFAPSVTVIEKDNYRQTIGGQSVFGQLSGPASAAVGGWLIGDGLKRSGDSVSTTNNNSTSATQGQLQLQGQAQGVNIGSPRY